MPDETPYLTAANAARLQAHLDQSWENLLARPELLEGIRTMYDDSLLLTEEQKRAHPELILQQICLGLVAVELELRRSRAYYAEQEKES